MKEIKNIRAFRRLMKSNKLILLDFHANWCGPCKSISPTIEKLAEQQHGDFEIVKINVDNNRNIAQEFGVRNIPALFFMKDGKVIESLSGNQTEEALKDKIQKHKENYSTHDMEQPSNSFWSMIF